MVLALLFFSPDSTKVSQRLPMLDSEPLVIFGRIQTSRPSLTKYVCYSTELRHTVETRGTLKEVAKLGIYCNQGCETEKWKSRSVVSDSLRPHRLCSPWNSPGQNTGVGSLSLLQGIFPTQGSNPGLPHCRQILYQLSHKGSPRILDWIAYPFSSRSSQPRNQTGVSCIAGRAFTNWAIREANIHVMNAKENFNSFLPQLSLTSTIM